MHPASDEDIGDPAHLWLRQTFGLTTKQIELAIALRQDVTLAQFAASHGVALESVRTRLRRIYRKLSVSSRVELLRELQRADGAVQAELTDETSLSAASTTEAPTQISTQASSIGVDRLVELYRLTRREADVASWLAAGLGTADIALALGIGVATVRCHLKSIYSKTWTRSQAELVNRILLSPTH